MNRISHFRFSKAQRSGIFFLVVIIVVLQGVIFFGEAEPGSLSHSQEAVDTLAAAVNRGLQLQIKEAERKGDTVYPFNPNYLTDARAYMLGLSAEEADRLLRYRRSGRYINSAVKFQEVTGIHDTLFSRLQASMKFPEFSRKRTAAPPVQPVKKDINLATEEELQQVYGVGPVLAGRIVRYRERLGGFLVPGQLEEVYGLSEEVFREVWARFELKELPPVFRLDVNRASLKELSASPYISPALAAKIVAYRSSRDSIKDLEELTKIHDFLKKDFDRIQLYLKVE